MAYIGPSYAVHVTMHVKDDQVDTFFEIFKPFHDKVVAEPECIFAELTRSPDKPGVFKFIENWNAELSWMMNVQSKKDAVEPIMVKPMEVEVWERFPEKKWLTVKKAMTE